MWGCLVPGRMIWLFSLVRVRIRVMNGCLVWDVGIEVICE